MKINLGSGYKQYPDFVNVDCDHSCQPDILLNLDDENLSIPLETNSVDKIIAHHIFEHIGFGIFRLLQEIYRICNHNALIDIRVPHHLHETYFSDFTHKRPITVEGLALFSKKRNKHDIEQGSRSSTLGIIYDVDFEIVSYDFVYDSFYDEIFKSLTQDQATRLLREATNVAIETHVVWRVNKCI